MGGISDAFEWVHPLVGGLILGFTAFLMMILNGRILGISGIFAGILRVDEYGRGDTLWRWLFFLGLLVGSVIMRFSDPSLYDLGVRANYGIFALAGLLVGFGTQLGSGCTSGHGLCGLGRASPRSFVSVMSFMASSILTAYIVNGLLTGTYLQVMS